MTFVPSPWSLALFLVGWACGWLLLWRLPRPGLGADGRPGVAVVVPARNEADALPALLASIRPQLRTGDELVVVDDESTDSTGAVAFAWDARLVTAPPLPDGWAGKAHACAIGAAATVAPVLAFVDADVRLAPDALDALVAEQARVGGLVSAQPWHETVRPYEQLSMFFNVSALAGGGACSVVGPVARTRIAYGPILLLDRDTYERTGGHAARSVRHAVAEDIALARLVGQSHVFAGPEVAAFRMYPRGVRQLVQGWSKNFARGARSVPWWAALGMVAWIWSLAAAPFTAVLCYLLSALQVYVQSRRVGRFGVLSAALYPLQLVFFLAVFLRSVVLTVAGRPVRWRDRAVPTR
jgi:4,4'-diaponeurosporenoate glycosyltransferase